MTATPTSRFQDAPRYMASEVVRATFCERETRLLLGADPDGSDGETVHVPAAHWYVRHADAEGFVAEDVVFRASHVPLPGTRNAFATRGPVVRALQVGARMHVEGDFESRDARAFLASVVRLNAAGDPVCHAARPLASQAQAVLRDPSAAAHATALARWREHLGAGFGQADELVAEINLYDLVVNAVPDVVSDGMAAIHGNVVPDGVELTVEGDEVTGASLKDGSLLKAIVQATGVPAVAFHEIRHLPAYRVGAFRSMGRRLLAPFLGDFPMERTLMVPAPPEACGPEGNPLERWASLGELVRETEGATAPEMPDYATGEMRHYRRDGIDVLCFSDRTASFTYVWPSPSEPSAGPRCPPATGR